MLLYVGKTVDGRDCGGGGDTATTEDLGACSGDVATGERSFLPAIAARLLPLMVLSNSGDLVEAADKMVSRRAASDPGTMVGEKLLDAAATSRPPFEVEEVETLSIEGAASIFDVVVVHLPSASLEDSFFMAAMRLDVRRAVESELPLVVLLTVAVAVAWRLEA